VLLNYLHACGMKLDWNTGQFIEEKTRAIRAQVGEGRVVLGLSGGVDSSVAAVLLHKAIGRQLTCVFVDTGVMRKDEMAQVQEAFAPYDMIVKWVDARKEFLGALDGVSDPEQKRKIIGRTFIEIFDKEAGEVQADFLAQGTLYPDVIESSGVGGAVLVKSHHNVGGLPDVMKLKLVEPLRELFKDEVRRAGLALGLPEDMVWRHPFPGPGLAVRIPGPVTPERVAILQNADAIFIEELKASGWYRSTSQCFAVLLPVQTVGIMGDERTYENMCALRAVTSEDFMTADWARLPHDLLEKVAQRIVNEVRGINRVVFDITSKPPATIEYE
jgi:GMP synthase (glutamine-hydrolysing)